MELVSFHPSDAQTFQAAPRIREISAPLSKEHIY